MKRQAAVTTMLCLAGGVLSMGAAHGQRGGIGNWTSPGDDPGHSGWQRAELMLSTETVPSQFKFLWKIKLGSETGETAGFSEPLLAPRLINSKGFKDFVYVASPDTLYAVDSELGNLLWKKQFRPQNASGGCGLKPLGFVMEAPQVINFGVHRTPGAPRPAPPPPPPEDGKRRLGGPAAGGYFALRGIYVLTSDGMLHEQVLTTGADYAAPVRFLPAAHGGLGNLNMSDRTVYTVTERGCGSEQNSLWSIDLTNGDFPVNHYALNGVSVLDVMGPPAEEDKVYIVTGNGTGEHANSVVTVGGPTLTVSDWYTPGGRLAKVAPVSFVYKDKQLIAAPGKDGDIVLLDGASLGGPDHHTPIAESTKVFSDAAGAWGGIAMWVDSDGTAYLYASSAEGDSAHGSVAAFKIEDAGDKLTLTPAWTLRDLVAPAPPVIGNGVLVALAEGSSKTHAKLYVLDGKTGQQLFTSGDTIPTYAHLSGLAMGDGHVFFTTHDNTLYSFGIGIEH